VKLAGGAIASANQPTSTTEKPSSSSISSLRAAFCTSSSESRIGTGANCASSFGSVVDTPVIAMSHGTKFSSS